ncbi:DUF2339 domain-containing protein [Candidatus Uhrbacteria bacterium]|nr:DUF2339 domain-containing protein [Candidatus Uhrbacteria bacterium]
MSTLKSLQQQIDDLKKQNERILSLLEKNNILKKESIITPIPIVATVPTTSSPSIQPALSISTEKKASNFEENIGIKWFSWIGIAALVIGVGFFIKYAIDNNLISYLARILIGGVFGVLLIIGGEYAARKEKYLRWGRGLTGGGLAIIYFIVYAAYHFVAYRNAIGISQGTDLALLGIVAAATVFFSLRDNSQIIAAEAFLLGFITALLGGDFQIATLLYSLILVSALIFVVAYKKWPLIGMGGLIGTYILYGMWQTNHGAENFWIALSFLSLYFLAHTIQTLLLASKEKNDSSTIEITNSIITVINAVCFFAFGFYLIRIHVPAADALFSVSLAVFYFFLSYISRVYHRRAVMDTSLYAGILFLTIAIPLQFDQPWITPAWSLLTLLFTMLGIRFRYHAYLYSSYFVGGITLLKTIFYDAWELHPLHFDAFMDSTRFFSFLFTTICFAIISFVAWKNKKISGYGISHAPLVYSVSASFLLCVTIFLEFIEYPHLITALWSLCAFILLCLFLNTPFRESKYQGITLSFIVAAKVIFFDGFIVTSGAYLLGMNWRVFAFASGIALFYCASSYLYAQRGKGTEKDTNSLIEIYSILGTVASVLLILLELKNYWISFGWGALGLFLLLVGFYQGRRQLRYQGIVLLGFTIFKVFLYDTREFSTLYRTISFMLLGGILLGTSFLYSKYKDKLKEIL